MAHAPQLRALVVGKLRGRPAVVISPSVRAAPAGRYVQQGRLAGARGTDQRDQLALPMCECTRRSTSSGLPALAKGLADVLELQPLRGVS